MKASRPAPDREPPEAVPAAMRLIPGGGFRMGSDHQYREEGPSREVHVDPFWVDETPVTNAEFAKFVAETGWVTLAETPPNPDDYPGILPDMVQAGSLVFRRPGVPTPL